MSHQLQVNADIPYTVPAPRLGAGSRRMDTSERQCIARSKNSGEQCKNFAIRGMQVCRLHGGSSPTAKHAAKVRLLAMCEPAFGVLEDCMADPDAEWDVKVKAALAVLDRAGFGPKATLTHKHKQDEDLDAKTEDQLVERGRKIVEILESRKQQVIDVAVERDAAGVSE
jgi:hypothetical protein